ncbi:diaminopimelate decarboxylase [Brachybacterium squillarum]|uniref:diaminopimelate decarboxylase n=1 Tax=Brachybacterium squillarum TaxID=661979 RepID=UPI00026296C8|nr:diaminopimelate decarboxylase [Brachybacterium squillarum]
MRAHEAGALHGNDAAPTWLPYPADVNHLIPGLWSQTCRRDADGAVEVGGVSVTRLAEEVGTPAFVLDEDDFRARARRFRDAAAEAFRAHAGGEVYYAGKSFLCTEVARWVDEDGLGLDVCTGGELAVALRAGFPPARTALHGNNKSDAEIRRALEVGVGRIVVDSLGEIDQVERIAAALGTTAPVMLRITTGVEAHTHEFIATAHEDQKFGLSLSAGDAFEAIRRTLEATHLELVGLHSHIGSQIFDVGGFEVAARRVIDLVARVREELGHTITQLDLGGGFGVMYNTQHTPSTPEALMDGIAGIVEKQCHEAELPVPHVSFEPGRAIAGPSTQTLYTVGTVKDVRLGGPHHRVYVSVDGGMSDNIRTALYDADYSCLLSNRVSGERPEVVRVVGKHCESGDIVVKDEYLPADVEAGDLVSVPVTGAYCYALASNYNHVPRPPVVAVKDGAWRTLLRRETEEDLLGLDQG